MWLALLRWGLVVEEASIAEAGSAGRGNVEGWGGLAVEEMSRRGAFGRGNVEKGPAVEEGWRAWRWGGRGNVEAALGWVVEEG